MNNKGFTLVELIAVFALLMLIFLLISPAIKKVVSGSQDTVYQSQVNTILTAAYNWSLNNPSKLPELNNKIYVTLGELEYYDYLESTIKNPETNEDFEDYFVISITNVGSEYKNNDAYSKKKGNYLFKAEIDLINNDNYKNRMPSIVLSDLTPDANGNYVTNVNLGSEYTEPKYTATSYDEKNITDKVIKNIFYNDDIVTDIDTNKIGIYYVKYTVIDIYGYANTITNSVIISDSEPPVIKLPLDNDTVDVSMNSFDLLNGVTCTDNSNTCKISVEGDIEFGTPGKYIITYYGKDDTGNTSSAKRVITVK